MLDAAAFIVGAVGIVFGLTAYHELWKWAKQCQNARIAIAHKKRVQINAPLSEWLSWANMLDKDQASTGRVVYRNAHVSVAILRPKSSSRVLTTIARVRNRRKRTRVPTGAGNTSNTSNAT